MCAYALRPVFVANAGHAFFYRSSLSRTFMLTFCGHALIRLEPQLVLQLSLVLQAVKHLSTDYTMAGSDALSLLHHENRKVLMLASRAELRLPLRAFSSRAPSYRCVVSTASASCTAQSVSVLYRPHAFTEGGCFHL